MLEYLTYIYEFSAKSFPNFLIVTFFTLLHGILLIALVNSLSNIRLFGKKDSNEQGKLRINPEENTGNKNTTVYDMLVQAYERHKNKGSKE